jgi:ABC-type glutathione transport system ATPase component
MAVLDEAFTALDPSMMAFCLQMLHDRLASAGTTLVFVSHLDHRLERFVEGRIIVLERNGEPRVAQPQ